MRMPDGPPSQRGLLGTHSAGSTEVDSVFLGLDRSVSSLVIRLVLTASNSPKHGRAPIEGWVKHIRRAVARPIRHLRSNCTRRYVWVVLFESVDDLQERKRRHKLTSGLRN